MHFQKKALYNILLIFLFNHILYYYYFTGDHLLVIGGWNSGDLSGVELINLGTQNKVCQPLQLEYPVRLHSSVVTSRGVITCGGFNGTFLKTCTLQTKDGKTRPFPSLIRSRYSFGMVVMDQSLIVVGGWGAEGKMETIGLNGNFWVEEDLPFSVVFHCFVSINETMMMAIGGYDGKNVSKRYFEFVNEKRLKREGKQLNNNFLFIILKKKTLFL